MHKLRQDHSDAANLQLRAYCDSDCASYPITRICLTSYFISLGLLPVSWKTKKQLFLVSVEVEYHSMAIISCELKWLQYLLRDL